MCLSHWTNQAVFWMNFIPINFFLYNNFTFFQILSAWPWYWNLIRPVMNDRIILSFNFIKKQLHYRIIVMIFIEFTRWEYTVVYSTKWYLYENKWYISKIRFQKYNMRSGNFPTIQESLRIKKVFICESRVSFVLAEIRICQFLIHCNSIV